MTWDGQQFDVLFLLLAMFITFVWMLSSSFIYFEGAERLQERYK